jgi:hypothetical protein
MTRSLIIQQTSREVQNKNETGALKGCSVFVSQGLKSSILLRIDLAFVTMMVGSRFVVGLGLRFRLACLLYC